MTDKKTDDKAEGVSPVGPTVDPENAVAPADYGDTNDTASVDLKDRAEKAEDEDPNELLYPDGLENFNNPKKRAVIRRASNLPVR